MNELKHKAEFLKLLANYEVSAEGLSVLNKARLVLFSAATATGRNTIIRELVKTGRYYFIVSDTTRLPRVNDGVPEEDGVEYWFRTEEDMLSDIKSGKFVEAEVIHDQQVSGMSIREIARSNELQKIAITDADKGGVEIVMREKPDTTCIFLLPPNYEKWQQRLRARGNMSDTEYQRRMQTAREELKNALEKPYYHFVVNDDLEQTIYVVDKIASGHESARHAAEARAVAEEILEKLG